MYGSALGMGREWKSAIRSAERAPPPKKNVFFACYGTKDISALMKHETLKPAGDLQQGPQFNTLRLLSLGNAHGPFRGH